MNPHLQPSISPVGLASSLWRHRALVQHLVVREVAGRYKGSFMGLAWSLFNPLFMLLVYTFVFSEVFQSRWGGADSADTSNSKTAFATILFAGMLVLNLFNEVVNRAPTLVCANTNYVKKVVFPLEILPVVCMGAALFHCFVSVAVLLAAYALFNGNVHWTVLCIPLVLAPLVVLTTGVAWMLASLGVYLRDVGQSISLLTLVLTFVSPVFYPIGAVPERFRPLLRANPLTFIIEQTREVLIWGHAPDWLGIGEYSLVAMLVAWAGYAWFQKVRKGFSDVL